jgi:hypothetical protein
MYLPQTGPCGERQADEYIQAAMKNRMCNAEIVQPASAHGQVGALMWGLSIS